MIRLLVQGLKSNDQSILNSVLDREDLDVIEKTVSYLPLEYLQPLLLQLSKRMQSKASSNLSHVRWTKIVIKTHAGYLISAPTLQEEILAPMLSCISLRTSTYHRVMMLKGKVDMINEQRRKNQAMHQNDIDDKHDLLVYQDESDPESDREILDTRNGEDNAESDDMEDYLSNQEDDDDDNSEDEDSSDMEQDDPHKMTNGHNESSEEDDEDMDDS